MATLQSLFGANAVQDATTLTLTKNDLKSTTTIPEWNYVPGATDTGEEVLAALLNRLKVQADANTDTANRLVECSAWSKDLTLRGTTYWQRYRMTITLYKSDSATAIPNPEDFA